MKAPTDMETPFYCYSEAIVHTLWPRRHCQNGHSLTERDATMRKDGDTAYCSQCSTHTKETE